MPGVMANPLGLVFPHKDNWYFFDTNSNMLLQIDPVLAAVLPHYGLVENNEILQLLAPSHSTQATQSAIDEIAQAQIDGSAFLARRPEIATTPRVAFADAGYGDNLEQLTLSLSEQCNLRCQYCLHSSTDDWIRPHRPQSMSLETARKSLLFFGQRCRRDGEASVSFYGGEPLLEFPLIKALIGLARSQPDWPPIHFIIDTNGTLITDEIADFICEEKIHLQISLDGPPAIHDRNRKTQGNAPTHQEIITGLERVLARDPEAGERMSFMATVTPPFDFQAIAGYFFPFPLFERLGITHTPFVMMNVASLKGLDPELFGEQSTFKPLLQGNLARMREVYLEHHRTGQRQNLNPVIREYFDKELIHFFHRNRQPLPDRIWPTGSCQPGQKRLHVKVDGTFQPCERVGERFPIGHVDAGFSQPEITDLMSHQFEAVGDRCSSCWAVRLCGLCFTSLELGEDTKQVPQPRIPEEYCQHICSKNLNVLKLYLDMKSAGPESLDFLQNSEVH